MVEIGSITRFIGTVVLAASLVATGVGAALAQVWQPARAVEIIVGTSAGGGQDTSARFVQKLIQEHKLVAVPMAVVNKPGAGSSIGYTYLSQQVGNGHHLMLLTVPLLTNYIMGVSSVSYADLTPISVLFDDYVAVTVKPDSPIKSGRDLMDRIRKDPSSVSVGIPSITGGGGLAILLAAKAMGVDPRLVKTVVFKSGGDSMTALLGGHIDVVSSTTPNVLGQLQAGKIRVIAITSATRLSGPLAGVATWKEQGVNIEFNASQGAIGPKGLAAPQLAFWENAFLRLSQSDEWKKELEASNWQSNYRNSQDTARYYEREYAEMKAVLGELGMVRQ